MKKILIPSLILNIIFISVMIIGYQKLNIYISDATWVLLSTNSGPTAKIIDKSDLPFDDKMQVLLESTYRSLKNYQLALKYDMPYALTSDFAMVLLQHVTILYKDKYKEVREKSNEEWMKLDSVDDAMNYIDEQKTFDFKPEEI